MPGNVVSHLGVCGLISSAKELLLRRNFFIPKRPFPFEQVLLQLVGEARREIFALCIGELAALKNSQDFIGRDRVSDFLSQLRHSARHLDGDVGDAVRVWNDGPRDDNAVGDSTGLRGRGFDTGGFDLIFAELDDILLVAFCLGTGFCRFRGWGLLGSWSSGRRESDGHPYPLRPLWKKARQRKTGRKGSDQNRQPTDHAPCSHWSPDASGKPLKISGDGLELAHHRTRRLAPPVGGHVETMIHVIMDQLPFCLCNGLLNGVELLRKVKAWATLLEHRDDSPNVPLGSLEPLNDIRMAFMDVRFRLHLLYPILWVRIRQAHAFADERCIATYLRALIYPIPQDTISASKSVLR